MQQENTALVDAMLRESDEKKQLAMIQELGIRGVTKAVEPLLRWVSPDYIQSGTAIVALGQIGDPLAVQALIRAYSHQSLAWIAKDALVAIGPAAVPALIKALTHAHPDVRFWAIRALGELNDPRAITPLQSSVTEDSEPTNQQIARTTLKNLLIAHLTNDDATTRRTAIEGLRWLDDSRAIEPLNPLADSDPDPAIRTMAETTVRALLISVNDDPFEAHDLPVRSRTTNLLIDKLRRACGVQLEKSHRPTDFAQETPTIDALRTLMTTHGDESVRTLAHNALQHLTFDYLRCPYVEARRVAVRGLYALHDHATTNHQKDQMRNLLTQIAEFDPDESVRQAARDSAIH